ncbi:Hypothetical Protein OBI_RACECAR_223 [Arthrobacter phage Racecar]|nr:hypothetical protein PBI_RACECAR_15 [Arthrobacter phage Racecar]QFG12700.1 hypothetical protein PBI_MIMI_15 [Arthrobacter phage Mimi]
MKDNHEGKSLTALKVGDKVKILEVLGIKTHRHAGKTGTVVEIVETDSTKMWVTPEGTTARLPLYSSEVEKINTAKFKVGDRVAFRLDGWATAEGVITHVNDVILGIDSYPYTVKITIEPGNNFHKAGQITYWREAMLKPALAKSAFKTGDRVTVQEEDDWRDLNGTSGTVECIWSRSTDRVVYSVKLDHQTSGRLFAEKDLVAETKFKVGDKVYVVNTSEGVSYKGKNGTVKAISEVSLPGINEQLYNVEFGDEAYAPLLRETALELRPKVEYSVGDKVRFTSNAHWNDGEGVIRGIDFSRGYKDYYKVEITKKPKLNVVYSKGDRVNLTDNEIAKIDRLSTEPLEVKDLESKEIGSVVVDVDGDNWVHIGFGQYAFKPSENELELNTAEALHENYEPLTDWTK